MRDYKLTEKERAEAVRLELIAQAIGKELQAAIQTRDAYLLKKAVEHGVPWSNPDFDFRTGEFKEKAQP